MIRPAATICSYSSYSFILTAALALFGDCNVAHGQSNPQSNPPSNPPGNEATQDVDSPTCRPPRSESEVEPAQFQAPADAAPIPSEVDLVSATESPAKPATGAAGAKSKPDEAAAPTSDAQRISRLERAIEDGEKRLTQLKANLSDPQGEYATAEAEFKKLDAEMEDARQTLREATEAAADSAAEAGDAATPEAQAALTADVAAAKRVVQALEPDWTRAKQRFEVELQERRVLKENIAIIEQKLQSDREASDKLKGVAQPTSPPDAATPAAPNGSPLTPVIPNATPSTAQPAAPSTAPSVAPNAPDAPPAAVQPPPATVPPTAASPLMPVPAASPDAATPQDPKTQKAPSKELVEAKQVAEQSAAEADAAEKEVRSITERIAILQKSINMERELRDAVRKKVDIAEEAIKSLDAELTERMSRGEDTEQLRLKISDESGRLREYRSEARRVATQLDKLQSELGSLQAEQLAAFAEAEKKRTVANEAQQKVEHLKNPFTARNVMQWALDHGPRLLSIFVAMGALVWISRLMQSRLVRLMAGRGPRGNRDERENRAKTLVSVFHNAANLIIIGGGAIMVLEEVGIPIGPLVGGAAVVGLAVAFGAQSLIKDYFTGFILLLEQQYLINDVIRVGGISGQVERISLRMTVLRDLEGRVHFIPHGEMSSVTNLTHGWSRAVMEIGVAYKENVDHVIATIVDLGGEMRRDAQFGKLILEDLTMLGVDAFGDSAVVIKLFIKTEPLQQWTVKREFLRRVKNRFDELGIEIPFPHRTVYHRQEAATAANAESDSGDSQDWSRKNAA